MQSLKGQLTLRSILIGCIGCVIITTASMYTALKMGMLPWPILFAAIVSLFFLKVFGKTNLSEVNVTHTVMTSGAMVAGGLAFTIPGIWILGYPEDAVSWQQMLIVALAGVVLGLICTAYLRKHFIEEAHLEFPLGEATSQTLLAGNTGGATGVKLFSAMGLAGIYTLVRDWFGALPVMLLNWVQIPGVAFGIYNSPMLLAIGFIVGTGAVVAWFIGALIGNFGIIVGGTAAGLWTTELGTQICSSLGMGLMMGCGVAVVLKVLFPVAKSFAGMKRKKGTELVQPKGAPSPQADALTRFLAKKGLTAGIAASLIAAVALVLCFALHLGPFASIIIVIFAWITTAMSAQSVGQTGIDPMEIFGLIVLLIVAAFSGTPQVQLFFVAGVIAVACGLTGDIMNDFKAGHNLGTDPRGQWIAQLIGGLLGTGVAVAVLCVLVQAYGVGAFGLTETFVSTQATIVATMISGIPCLPAFIIGLVVGAVLYFFRLPSMMIGLGVYLPFFLSLTAFLGVVVKFVYHFIGKRKRAKMSKEAAEEHQRAADETGLVISSGVLGGESIAGVAIALIIIGQLLVAS
ncbi:MAG: OPT/YSL family transporter [Coriobacteriales bacterium]|nr:OPT/YSL family transporter [Coriobacteriales bacterium]